MESIKIDIKVTAVHSSDFNFPRISSYESDGTKQGNKNASDTRQLALINISIAIATKDIICQCQNVKATFEYTSSELNILYILD